MKVDLRCQLCGNKPESANQIFLNCHVTRGAWAKANFPTHRLGFHATSIYQNFDFIMKIGSNNENYKVYPWILWRLWKNKYRLIFEEKYLEISEIVAKAVGDFEKWFPAH